MTDGGVVQRLRGNMAQGALSLAVCTTAIFILYLVDTHQIRLTGTGGLVIGLGLFLTAMFGAIWSVICLIVYLEERKVLKEAGGASAKRRSDVAPTAAAWGSFLALVALGSVLGPVDSNTGILGTLLRGGVGAGAAIFFLIGVWGLVIIAARRASR